MEVDIPYIASMGIRRIYTALFGEYICAISNDVLIITSWSRKHTFL